MTSIPPIYDRDGITIYNADCRDVLAGLDADGFAVMLTDPPYGMAFIQGKRVSGDDTGWTSRWTGKAIQNDGDTSVRDEALEWWGDRPALVFGTWKAPAPRGVREVLVWDKVVSTGMGALDIPWRPSWEAIYVLGRGFEGRRGHGVLRHSLPTLAPERQMHPTPKPVPLIVDLLSRCPDGAVIDPFMGSGPVAVACQVLGRRYVGIELVPEYCQAAINRLAQPVLFAAS